MHSSEQSPRVAGAADHRGDDGIEVIVDRDGHEAEDPTEIGASGWMDIARRVKEEFNDDHVTLTAAGVAFFFFLSLVPLLVAGVSIYGLIADPSDVTALAERLGSQLPESTRNLITDQLTSIVSSSSGSLGLGVLIGIGTALWSGSSGFAHLVEGLNIAYDEEEDRSFFIRRGLALLLTLGFLSILGLSGMALGAAGALDEGTPRLLGLLGAWVVIGALFALFLAALYRYGPNRDEPQWEWTSVGAILAVVLWTVMTLGFGIYVSNFGSYNETYGSLGAIVITLTWMYLTAVVVVIGAEVNTETERQTLRDSTTGRPDPIGRRGADAADTIDP